MDSMLWLETLKGELLFSTTRLVRFDLLSGVVMSAWKREEALLQRFGYFSR